MTGPYTWLDPADARFVAEARAALRLERKAWELCHASRNALAGALLDKHPGWKGEMLMAQFELSFELTRRGIGFRGTAGATAAAIAALDAATARIKELEAR